MASDSFPPDAIPEPLDEPSALQFRRMSGAERLDVFALLRRRIPEERVLGASLALFAEREDLGFVWLGFIGERAVAACTVAYAISTRSGQIVARLDDVVAEGDDVELTRALVGALVDHARGIELGGVEIELAPDDRARSIYEALGFRPLGTRLGLVAPI